MPDLRRYGCFALMGLLLCILCAAPASARNDRQSVAAKQEQVTKLRNLAWQYRTTVYFWQQRGKWALHRPGTKYGRGKCWQVKGQKRKKVCRMARRSLVTNLRHLSVVSRRLERLTAPQDTGYLPPSQARLLGQKMATLLYGWDGEEWNCLDALWGSNRTYGTLESDWNVLADNPGSDAYGIPQALPGSKMSNAGANWLKSAYVQIKWGLGYIHGRFSTPCSALSHRLANGSY